MNELILIRHGESKSNALLTDNLDSELTPRGEAQVRATGKFLREHFGHIQDFAGVTSPYHRCLQTARILAEETGIEFTVGVGPREIMVKYDECVVPYRSMQFKEFRWLEHLGWQAGHTFHKETADYFVARMEAFVERLKDDYQKVLVVSHGTPIGAMYEMALGLKHRPNITEYVTNASISYIRNTEGIWFGKVVYEDQ